MSTIARSSGILLHITSLPSAYGIGSMGCAAYAFIDFLKRAHQTYWQILPICPPGYGNSPYQAFSTFAGNPLLIDLDLLVNDSLLLPEDLSGDNWGSCPDQVDFALVYSKKSELFRKAFRRFQERIPKDYHPFLQDNCEWLEEYALFMAIKEYYGNVSWMEWEPNIRCHRPHAAAHYRAFLKDQMEYHYFLQYIFFRQWGQLRAYAHKNGIQIIGDLPIYVPLDSADVWSNPHHFQLTRARKPKVVAGCPPDGFNRNGQYWGNPIYDWKAMEQDCFRWWLRRIGFAVKNFDVVRIDHFRGIESYWSIPAANKTARNGHWVKGPGMKLISAIQNAYPNANFIAEDLGFLTPEVLQMVEESGFPGMKVLEFAFDPREPSDYLPHKYSENCICYTGTHDNETLVQWCSGISKESKAFARKYLNLSPDDDLAEAIITAGMHSHAKLFIAQMQDYLRLGKESRMNEPGTLKPENWRWRMLPNAADNKLADELAALTAEHSR